MEDSPSGGAARPGSLNATLADSEIADVDQEVFFSRPESEEEEQPTWLPPQTPASDEERKAEGLAVDQLQQRLDESPRKPAGTQMRRLWISPQLTAPRAVISPQLSVLVERYEELHMAPNSLPSHLTASSKFSPGATPRQSRAVPTKEVADEEEEEEEEEKRVWEAAYGTQGWRQSESNPTYTHMYTQPESQDYNSTLPTDHEHSSYSVKVSIFV
jgi:hypothetical protein